MGFDLCCKLKTAENKSINRRNKNYEVKWIQKYSKEAYQSFEYINEKRGKKGIEVNQIGWLSGSKQFGPLNIGKTRYVFSDQ